MTTTTTSFRVAATRHIDRTGFALTAARAMAGRDLDLSLRILGVRR